MTWVARIKGKEVSVGEERIFVGKGDKHLSDVHMRVVGKELQVDWQRDENYRPKGNKDGRSRRVYSPTAINCEFHGERRNLVEELVDNLRTRNNLKELEAIEWKE